MNAKKIIALLLALVMCVGLLAACGDKNPGTSDPGTSNPGTSDPGTSNSPDVEKTYTYHTYTALSPSNWNELTYQDNNDTQIMSYIGGSFFGYDFAYDENGEIIPGDFEVVYTGATKLEDVTAKYAEAWGLPADGKGFAYAITLREDIKWDDGTPIKAEDFVYTMQQQLDPLFQNYRADSFYAGATVIVNAQNYVKQGQSGWYGAADVYSVYSEDLDSSLVFTLGPDSEANSYIRDWVGFPDSYDLAATVGYLAANYGFPVSAEDIALIEGKTLAEIKADASLKAIWENALGWWQTEPNEELHFFATEYAFPAVDFSEVGIFVGENEYELVIVLEKSLPLLKDDGSLSYQAAYNMSSLPLVKKDLFESCKIAPSEGTTLWTSKYNSSVETTASWGAYSLESFQSGTQYTMKRNEYWYGYNMPENEGLYQTDRIVCDTIKEWNAAWLKFLAGEIDGIGIDISVADDYKGSDRAYFTPDDFVASMQLQSDKEQLKARETDGVNKTILSYVDFRKALSLGVNRADFATQTTTSSLAGFGLFNSMHYYDVENGGAYRNTDEAKQVLCNVYGVDASQYENLDKAVESITGYNLDLARQLVTKAYNEALANGDIKETDKVVLTMGSGAINETVQRRFNYISDAWKEMVVGTPLEGRLETETKDFGDAWANDFRAGGYDVCMGGWTGAAWDPGYFLLAYLSPDYMYSSAWDTSSVQMTFTMKGVGENGADITETMSLMDWYDCLNGASGAKYDWSATALPNSQRLQLIAALEEQVLGVYYTVPLYNNFSASLLSYKVDYITYEYNTFMAYGGMKYMTYNFDDAAWAAEVANNGGELNYK